MMHYVCIENGKVVSVLNYLPNVPSSVSIVEISDAENNQLVAGTHRFDVASKQVVLQDQTILDERAAEKANADSLEFLRSTDWKVLRHIREKALGVSTSMTEAQYIELEHQRAAAAARVI